ncbi:MAG TPA: hypothetical protein GXX56_08980 [Rhodocyclaceae bacterium]|nr:hypothetical protein [Rhodocyclaceae bacterium]
MNEYDALIAQTQQADTAQSARVGFAVATDTNPDAYAEAQRVARRTGVPVDTVLAMPKEMKQQDTMGTIDFDALAKTAPATASLLSDIERAKVAHDNLPNMTAIERSFFEAPYEAFMRGAMQGRRGLTLLFDQMGIFKGLERQRAAAAAAHGISYDPSIELAVRLAQQQREVERYPVPDDIAQGMQDISNAQTMGDAFTAIRTNPRAVLETTLQSLGASAPALVGAAGGSVFGPGGTATGAGLGSFAVEYSNTLQDVMAEKGVNGTDSMSIHAALNNPELMAAAREKALKRGIPVAIFDALTAGLAGKLLAGAKPTVGSVGARAAGELGLQAGGGAAGEAGAQLATGEYKPGDILMEAFAEMPTAIIEVPGNYRHAMESAQRAQKGAEFIDNLNKLVQADKLVARDPQTFEQFVAQAAEAGPVQQVFIDAQTLMQSGVAQQVAAVSPAVASQLATAAQTGGQIAIPVEEYAARIAPTEYAQGLLDHLKTEPEGFSRAEAQQFMQSHAEELQAEVERTLAEKQVDDTFKASAEVVRNEIRSQLDTAARFTPQVNDAYSAMVGNFYATMAAKMGTTPEELFQRYPLKIAAERIDGPQFEQEAVQTDTPEFRNWFGDSKVVDADGKPLTVYHGTTKQFTTFEEGKKNGWSVPRKGFYFTDEKNVAEEFGKPTDVFLSLRNPIDLRDMSANNAAFWQVYDFLPDEQQAEIDNLQGSSKPYLAVMNGLAQSDEFIAAAKRAGFDGMVFGDQLGGGPAFDSYVAFEPTQIKSATQNRGTFDPNDPNILHQFAGQRAQGADLHALDTAKQRIAAGENPETVRRDTGWFKGNDGKWRYEISDADAKFTGKDNLEQAAEADPYKLAELPLGDVLDHPALFAAYPKLRNITVAYEATSAAGGDLYFGASYNSTDNTISLGNGLDNAQQLSALLHEIQHGIQNIEGFATGGSLEIAGIVKAQAKREWDHWSNAYTIKREMEEAGHSLDEAVAALNDLDFGINADQIADAQRYTLAELKAKNDAAYAELQRTGDGPRSTYLKIAGEVEARNTQARAGMTDEQRRATPPGATADIADQDVILVFNGKEMEHAPAIANAFNQEARGAFNPASLSIALLKNADLSTFLHESGHFFLEVQADLASKLQQEAEIFGMDTLKPGERQILADTDALLKWFGLKDLNEWNGLDFEQKRSYHEQFARGFEAYLFEGKAPSIELQGLFQRFRAWLLSVYRELKALNVELTDEVRGVFDRLLATNEQITLAEQGRSMMPLFTSPEQAGMTPEEFAAYQALGVDATAQAIEDLQARGLRDMRWLHNARGRIIKQLQKDAKAQRAAVEMDVRREVMSQPIYHAWQFLTGKLTADDKITPPAKRTSSPDSIDETQDSLFAAIAYDYAADMETRAGDQVVNPQALGAGRFDMGELKAMGLPTEVINAVQARRMTAGNGLHPDIVAELFGFTSGDELVRKLAQVETPSAEIEALTDVRMLEQYGDLSSPEAIERAADKAIHNDVRARMVATEANALAKAAGQRKTLTTAAKEFAAAMVARLKVRNVKPGQYANAEVRAAKAAEKASRDGDIATAAAEKRNQLINTYATRAAHDALDDVDAGLRYLKRFDGKVKGLDAEYLDQIDALLERFDLRKGQSLKAIDKRKSFTAWLQAQREAGLEPDIPETLENDAYRVSYKDMTVEEFRGLLDTIKQIEHLGRLKNKLLTAKDERELAAIVAEAEASIRENGGKERPVELETPRGFKPWLEGIAAGHRKLASLLRQMDGGKDNGPMWRALGRAMNDAGTAEAVMIEDATMRLSEIFKPILAMKGGTTGDKRFIPAINASLTRGGRLAVALNWGNETNRQRIMDGDRWSPAQVNAILSTLTRDEWTFVQNTWDFIDSYWPDIAAKEKRVTGRAPDKVQAAPFSVTLADGTVVNLRGGYYPIKYDSNRDDKAEKHDAAAAASDMMRGAFTRSTTRRGHTKERVENVKRPVKKTLDVITQHVSEVAHDLAWHEWLIDANRLIDEPKINQAVRDHYGTEVIRTIKDTLQGIATADIVPQTKMDQALLYLRANVSRATMGLSLTTAFLQPFGLTQSMVRIGPKYVLRGLARWGGDIARFQNAMTWIGDKSDFMRLRNKTFNRELHEIKGRVVQGRSQARQIYDASLFMLMQKMQLIADVPTWIGAYEKALAENHDDATAVAMADQAVLDSQGGGQTKDMSELQRKHPMLTMFYSYFNVTLNLAAESTAKTDFKNPLAVAGWLSDMALLMVIPALGPALILHLLKGGGDEDDDLETWLKRMAEWQAGYLLGTVIGARELSGTVAGFDYTGPPAGRIITELGRLSKQAQQGELDEGLAMSAVQVMGAAVGIPSVQIVRSWRGWNAWAEDDAPATSILLGPPPKD